MPDLLYEKRDHFAIFTMNRPERLNALGGAMQEDLKRAVADFEADPEMRAGIVTGAGRAFCAGADLKESNDQFSAGQTKPTVRFSESAPYSLAQKPYIAAVNGLAVGGGLERALDCDIRICSTNAWFALFEPKRGRMAGYAIHHLPRMINLAAASYMLLTGDRVEPGARQGVGHCRRGGRAGAAAASGDRDRGDDRGQRPAGGEGHQGCLPRLAARQHGLLLPPQRVGLPGQHRQLGGHPRGRPRLRGEAPARLAGPLTAAPQPTGSARYHATSRASRSAISSGVSPARSPSTAAVCSPSRGARRLES